MEIKSFLRSLLRDGASAPARMSNLKKAVLVRRNGQAA
jgi:hypothetical protein